MNQERSNVIQITQSTKNRKSPKISFYSPRRIHLNPSALKALDNPSYIQIMWDYANYEFSIVKCGRDDPSAIEIPRYCLKSNGFSFSDSAFEPIFESRQMTENYTFIAQMNPRTNELFVILSDENKEKFKQNKKTKLRSGVKGSLRALPAGFQNVSTLAMNRK